MKYVLVLASMMAVLSSGWAQTSPPETATGKIGSATLVIKYCAPSVRGRQIFGEGGRVMQDPPRLSGAPAQTMPQLFTPMRI